MICDYFEIDIPLLTDAGIQMTNTDGYRGQQIAFKDVRELTSSSLFG